MVTTNVGAHLVTVIPIVLLPENAATVVDSGTFCAAVV
jgi:hypothetical protein